MSNTQPSIQSSFFPIPSNTDYCKLVSKAKQTKVKASVHLFKSDKVVPAVCGRTIISQFLKSNTGWVKVKLYNFHMKTKIKSRIFKKREFI